MFVVFFHPCMFIAARPVTGRVRGTQINANIFFRAHPSKPCVWQQPLGEAIRERVAMVRPQCPTAIRKYGFCGLLATLYAARQPIPSSKAKFEACLKDVKRILSISKGKWREGTEKRKGAISLSQTLELLSHYNTCEYEVTRLKEAADAPTLRQWMKTAPARSCFIVHTKTHAMFVEINAVKSKYRIYDQGGAHVKGDGFLDKTGGYGRQKLRAVIKIAYRD